MSTTSIGRAVEDSVRTLLERKGYCLVAQNWRTPTCEIDLVMSKDNTMHFIEVKFRKSFSSGAGDEYITPKKQKQMTYAAELWCAKNKWSGDALLVVASVDGWRSTVRFIELT